MPIEVETFIEDYLKAIEGGYAAVFAGAGLSASSGFVNWKQLLAGVVKELKLDPNTENLVAVAQYHVNERQGRHKLNQLLIHEFTKDAKPNRNHELLARLPIHTVWTTNYDTLIEDAFEAEYKRVDVKHRVQQLATTKPGSRVILYKMNGDISAPDQAVLVKQDFELYDLKREMFSHLLRGDLLSKTMLFIGFSFTDPNIDYILGRIHGLMGENRRDHYCFLRRVPKPPGPLVGAAKAQYQYETRHQDLLIGDLRRYGIQTVLVEAYQEITDAFEKLNRLAYRKSVFVSGSAVDHAPLGQPRLEGLCQKLGQLIVKSGRQLTSGLGLGIGGSVVLGAVEAVYSGAAGRVDEQLNLRPFPHAAPPGPARQALYTRYREDMLAKAGVVIFVSGNKVADGPADTVAVSDGVLEEFRIATKLGHAPIPLGCTGGAAAQIWREVMADVAKYYPRRAGRGEVRAALKKLNDSDATDGELLGAVSKLLDLAASP